MTNKELVLKVYDDVFNNWDTSNVDAYFREDYKQHNPGVENGREGFKKFLGVFLPMKPHMEIVKIADNKVCMFGNIGPIKPLWQGTPEEVKKDVERSIDAGFRMIAPGCSFVPMTPGANIKAMTDAVKASKKSFAKGKN